MFTHRICNEKINFKNTSLPLDFGYKTEHYSELFCDYCHQRVELQDTLEYMVNCAKQYAAKLGKEIK